MSLIYERTISHVTNEVYHSSNRSVQFQFLGKGNCISVWNGGMCLMLVGGDLCDDGGWVYNESHITIYNNGEVSWVCV